MGADSERTSCSGGRKDRRGNGPENKIRSILNAYHEEGVFNWGLVGHGSKEVITDLADHDHLEESVSHHELLAGTGNVAIVVQDTHASESGDVHLKGDVGLDVEGNLGLLGWVCTNGLSSAKDVERAVPDFINHYY